MVVGSDAGEHSSITHSLTVDARGGWSLGQMQGPGCH
jgi:hypothetical protein